MLGPFPRPRLPLRAKSAMACSPAESSTGQAENAPSMAGLPPTRAGFVASMQAGGTDAVDPSSAAAPGNPRRLKGEGFAGDGMATSGTFPIGTHRSLREQGPGAGWERDLFLPGAMYCRLQSRGGVRRYHKVMGDLPDFHNEPYTDFSVPA